MGISEIAPAENRDRVDRARWRCEVDLGDGRYRSDVVPSTTHERQSSRSPVNRYQSDPCVGAHSNFALARDGSAAQELPVSLPSNLIPVAYGRFHPNAEARLTPHGYG
jgi:hypothetical protein